MTPKETIRYYRDCGAITEEKYLELLKEWAEEAPTEAQIRKGRPVATGVLAYFPDAIDAIAEVSRRGNDQHNPGQPLHWARDKSTDQLDAASRHLMDYLRGHKRDKDGNLALAQVAWRIMAQLQLDLEAEGGK